MWAAGSCGRGRTAAFGFRHVLVQESVYRSAPKRLRAELHERYADRIDTTLPDIAELDEFVGYHLERAYRLRTELGESNRRTERLAQDGGRRLGVSGVRALKRGDMHATRTLLERATFLLSVEEPLRRELLCELAIAVRAQGDPTLADTTLTTAIQEARTVGDRRLEMRARIERDYVRLLHDPGTTADGLLDDVAIGVPIFEAVGDDRSLGRASLLAGFVHGGHRGRHRKWEEAAERALVHYKKAGWPTSTCLGEIAYALYYGPTPVAEAIIRCEKLLRDEVTDSAADANVRVYIGGLLAQRGDVDSARRLVTSATATYEDLGQRTAVAYYSGAVHGDIELLAGDEVAAERVLRALCLELESTRDWSHLASRAGDLAEALYVQNRIEEADEWTRTAEIHAAVDDVDAGMIWRPVRAKILARRDAFAAAESTAREAVELAATTDATSRHARAIRDLGEVLRLAGRLTEAGSAFQRAEQLYEQKGNLLGAAQARAHQRELALI